MNRNISREDLDELEQDNDLKQIEARFSKFNIFFSMGVQRSEIRHSNFLASLLDPHENHGMGANLLREFLTRVTEKYPEVSFDGNDFPGMNLSAASVFREYKYIDLLIVDRTNGFVCCIENKIGAGEHGDQLTRYEGIVERDFPAKSYPNRYFFYLTPNGSAATNPRFLPISYDLINAAIEAVRPSYTQHPELYLALEHYSDLLRRSVLKQDELARLCQQIYQRHRKALDTIYEYASTDPRQEIRAYLREMIGREARPNGLIEDDHTLGIIRFADEKLDSKSWMRTAAEWTSSGRIVLFEFTLKQSELLLELVVGQGEAASRSRIFSACGEAPFTMKVRGGKYANYQRIWKETILAQDDFETIEEEGFDKADKKIRVFWERFLKTTLPAIRARLSAV